MPTRQRIAVIGSGIAGMATAWLLNRQYDVTVFEKDARAGGHSNTVDIDYDGTKIAVDTGFIVYNHATYPHLKALFEYLAVPTKKSNMSFGVSVGRRIEYASHNARSIFANPALLFSPHYWQMLADVTKFNRKAPELLSRQSNATLGDYIAELGLKSWFKDYYLLPMGAAIWSCPAETMMRYPAAAFIRFFHNHGLLTVTRQPQWYTVDGGSREYVKRILAPLNERVRVNAGVKSVTREGDKVAVALETGEIHLFDQVVIAAHGDQALTMLGNPSEAEKEILSCFTYQKNRAVLHRDTSVMPKHKAAWASWVCARPNMDAGEMAVHYWMNNLQGIDKEKPLFVSLNPNTDIAADKTFAAFDYEHPVFDGPAVAAQEKMPTIQGVDKIWYAGSYHRYGFHEDALLSAVNVAAKLGVRPPWQ